MPLNGGPKITIEKDVTLVGRQREHCDLVIDRKSISKMHCILIKSDGLLFVRDLSSTNGTKVNGQRITRGALLPGDQLEFASEKFRVHLGPDETSPPAGHDRTEMLLGIPARPDAENFGDQRASSSDIQPVADSLADLPDDLVE